MKDFAATVSESAAIKTIKDNIYKFVKFRTALPTQTALKTTLLSKLNSFSNLKTWVLQSLDEAIDANLISKLNSLDASDFTKLDIDLFNSTYGPEIKALLKENPDDLLNIWKRLKDDPAYSWELQKTGGSRWEKWSQREFFKDITAKGKGFEEFVSNNLSILRTKLIELYPNIDINDFAIFEQVQIKTGNFVNGLEEFFVADFVLVKKEVNAITGVENLNFNNAIVLETKLSSTTALINSSG